MKGISLWKIYAVSGSLHQCWKGSPSPQTKGLCQLRASGLVLAPPLWSLPGGHGLLGRVKSHGGSVQGFGIVSPRTGALDAHITSSAP